MKHLLLLMKYNIILRAKAFISFRGLFLFLCLLLGVLLLAHWSGQSPLYHFSYYTEEDSYATQVAIENFTKSFESIAQIKKMDQYSETSNSDVLLYFPKDFAVKWQEFSESPVMVHIRHHSLLHRILLSESFKAYEEILFTSESFLQSYHQYLFQQNISAEDFKALNQKISLAFISAAVNRQKLSKNKPVGILPANISKEYYLIGFSLFLGLLLALYFSYDENAFYQKAKRIMLTNVSGSVLVFASFLTSVLFAGLFTAAVFLLIDWGFNIHLDPSFYFIYPLMILAFQQCFQLISWVLKDPDHFMVITAGGILLSALLGGLFLPITLAPSEWIFWIEKTPFYQLFYYLMLRAVTGAGIFHFIVWIAFVFIFLTFRLTIWRKYRYV